MKNLLIFFSIVLVTFLAYLPTISDYGVTWDEFLHRGTGGTYLTFIKEKDFSIVSTDEQLSWYPPVVVTGGQLLLESKFLTSLLPFAADRFHLAAIIYGSVTVGMIWLISYQLTRNRVLSLYASAILATFPQFYTHSHMNVRDIGMTMFYTLTIYLLFLIYKTKRLYLQVILAAIAGGITTDSKQNGGYLLFIGILWLMILIKRLGWKKYILAVILYCLFFVGAFILFWPYLWFDTLNHLALAWHFLTNPTVIAGSTTFYDQIYTSMRNIPVYYPYVLLFLLTPPLMGLVMVAGLFTSVIGLIRKNLEYALILLWLVVPLSRFFFPLSSITYDQIRHFIEVVPSLAIFSIISIYTGFKHFQKKKPVLGYAVIFIAMLIIGINTILSLKYQPYGTAYFNMFAGSPSYVTHAFDVEFWGNVYREAVYFLNNYNTKGDSAVYFTAGTGAHLLDEDGLIGNFTDIFEEKFDYVVFMNKQNVIKNNPYTTWLIKNKKPFYTIERYGVILFYAYEPYKDEYKQSLEG